MLKDSTLKPFYLFIKILQKYVIKTNNLTCVIILSEPSLSSSLKRISGLWFSTRSEKPGPPRVIAPFAGSLAPYANSEMFGKCCLYTKGVAFRLLFPFPGLKSGPQEVVYPVNINITIATDWIERWVPDENIPIGINQARQLPEYINEFVRFIIFALKIKHWILLF